MAGQPSGDAKSITFTGRAVAARPKAAARPASQVNRSTGRTRAASSPGSSAALAWATAGTKAAAIEVAIMVTSCTRGRPWLYRPNRRLASGALHPAASSRRGMVKVSTSVSTGMASEPRQTGTA
ncbi:hypothetical protein D3C75_889380 [compost metagenome]